MKKKSSRIVALVLTLCMVFFGLPVTAMANENDVVSYNGATYSTIADAVAEIHELTDGARMEEHIITLKGDVTCAGFAVGYDTLTINDDGFATTNGNNPVNVVIDLNGHTYYVSDKPTVGSSGTESNGFQFLKDSYVTFRNGTIIAEDNTGILFQNYCNLTLDDISLTTKNTTYALSNNCGNVNFIGSTSITVETGYAFDVCVAKSYPEGVTVTVDTTGTITGSILYDKWGDITGQDNKAFLKIMNGTIKGDIVIDNGLQDAAKKNFVFTGGTFFVNVSKYLAHGLKQDEEGNVVPDEGINFVVNGVGGFETLDDALDEAEDGSVITLWNDVPVTTDSALKIQKDITIKSAEGGRKTITLTNGQDTDRAKLIVMSADLTLDNVALTLKPTAAGNGDGIQMGSDPDHPVTLTLKNDAVLTFANNGDESVQNAFVMPAGAGAKVIVDNSQIIAKGVDGNFSNGGIFTLRNGSKVNINDCASYGLSVNGLTVDNSNLTIDRTVLSAIRTSSENAAVKVVNRGKITVTNSGGGLPRQSRWGDATGVIDIGHGNEKDETVPATLTVDEKSSIVLENNKNEADFVYLTGKASYAVSGKVTKIEQEALPANYYGITYTVNGNEYSETRVPAGEPTDTSITFTEPDDPVVSGYTFQKWNYPDGTNVVEDGTVTFPVKEDVFAYTVTASLEKKPTPTTSDDGPSLGYRLPYIGETTGGKNFVSDTTSNLTVNGKYQFRITSTDGHKPVMTVSNSNFTVELASQSGNDYFYVIRCAGAAGSTANVLVDGYQVVVATVGTAGVVSDTTHPFTVAQGATYQFKLTSASRPTFTGNNANFTIAYVGNSGNDWFFKVTAVGAAGASTTFSANGVAVTTATIA